MELPSREYQTYAGIDPGFQGAVAVMTAQGTAFRLWDLPVCRVGRKQFRQFDVSKLGEIIRTISRLPDPCVGLENPTTRPGEGAERSARFGRGLGILDALLVTYGLPCFRLSPNLWKGRLGLPGKTDSAAIKLAAEVVDRYYPRASAKIRGPRGGLKDGRIDAMLIAHFLRTGTMAGMKSVVDQFGKNSPEAMAFVLQGGRRQRKPPRNLP